MPSLPCPAQGCSISLPLCHSDEFAGRTVIQFYKGRWILLLKLSRALGPLGNRSNKWKGNCRGWPCQTSDYPCSMAKADSPFLSGSPSPLLLPLLRHQFPSHQVGRGYPLSLHSPLGTYSPGVSQNMFSLFPRDSTPCPCALNLVLGAENLGWRWDISTKQDVCQFLTRPDFAF